MKPTHCKKSRSRRRKRARDTTKKRSWSQITTEIYRISPETQTLIKKAVDGLSDKR